ncbi:hypothetical protein TNCV_4814471 [Trichonephila clavipes]|nr:hypothetical protein TNCV_4814471 [Trichonephila clavipes]
MVFLESYTLLSTSQYNLCDCRQRLIVAKCGGFTAQHPFIPIQFSGNPVTSPAIVAFPNAERQETGYIPVRSILLFAGLQIGFCEWTGLFAGTDFSWCRACLVENTL